MTDTSQRPQRPFKIAVIPGDGIGKEVMPEGLRVLDAAGKRFGIPLEYRHIEWASCDYYAKHGQMMPDDWKQQLDGVDAILFGAVGWPETVPDHISLWGSLLKFRREFDQYINLRPARLFDGVPSPLAGRAAGDIDFLIVRENTEGEYSSVGGVMFEGTEREFVVQESIFTRHGTERVLKFAFDLAQQRARKHVTVATKSNGISISMPWWDKRAAETAAKYPDIKGPDDITPAVGVANAYDAMRLTALAIDRAGSTNGDAIRTDIAGAAGFGAAGIMVLAGIHAQDLMQASWEERHGWFGRQTHRPDYAIPHLVW